MGLAWVHGHGVQEDSHSWGARRALRPGPFDTGASKSLIRRDVARKVARLPRASTPWTFQLGDGRGKLKTNEMAGLFFQLKGVPIVHTFIVPRHLSEEVIIGTDLMQFWKVRPDPVRKDVVIDKKLIQLKLV